MAIPEQAEPPRPRRTRYYVLRVHDTRNGDPGLVSVTSGPYVGFLNAWCSAGEMRRIYRDQIFIAGEMGSLFQKLEF